MQMHFVTIILVAYFAVEMHSLKSLTSFSVAKLFEDESIVPNIISKSPPSILKVEYETATAELGNDVCPLRTILPPVIYFDVQPGSYYTFVFIDPDQPSRAAPTVRNHLLALYVNMVNSDLSSGFPLAPYIPPTPVPGSGSHRSIALVYEQSDRIEINNQPLIESVLKRVRFSVNDFAINNTLGDPIAGNFFLSAISNDYERKCNKYIYSY